MATGPVVQLWATAMRTNESNGRKIFFRYARVFSPAFDRASQPVRIILVWRFQSESGQPATEEQQRMSLFEDALEPVLEQERFATLALVSTGENLREWIYYSKSQDGFAARYEYALAGMPAFPIEIHVAHDPLWSTYDEFKMGLREG